METEPSVCPTPYLFTWVSSGGHKLSTWKAVRDANVGVAEDPPTPSAGGGTGA